MWERDCQQKENDGPSWAAVPKGRVFRLYRLLGLPIMEDPDFVELPVFPGLRVLGFQIFGGTVGIVGSPLTEARSTSQSGSLRSSQRSSGSSGDLTVWRRCQRSSGSSLGHSIGDVVECRVGCGVEDELHPMVNNTMIAAIAARSRRVSRTASPFLTLRWSSLWCGFVKVV